ncbi:phage tail assembly chaperone [Desulfovulcanus sp.]
MFVYTKDDKGEILVIAEKDVLTPGSYYAKFEYEGERPEGDFDHYIFDGTNFVLRSDEEITAIEAEKVAIVVKQKRNKLIDEVVWMLDRHRNQKEFGLATTITDEQATVLAQYIQKLRDIPEQEGFPFEFTWPEKPDFV